MATAVIGALRVNLGLNSAEFSAGAARAQRSLDGLGRSMQRSGAIMSAAITAPLLLLGRSMVNAAVDAEELQSAFNYSFGSMADDMNAWAVSTGDALGRSTQALQQAAFSFNQLFVAAAPTREAAAGLSQDFAALAQDLASFFNVTEDQALEKLRAGLVGEAEPLRAFGVFLSAAEVESRALAMGLGDLSGELTEQDKILARAAIIMDQTADAQGDLARTSESAANQQRAMQAEWQELSVTLGQILLPIVTDVVGVISDLVGWFKDLEPGVQKAIVVTAGLAAVLGPLLLAFGSLVRAVGIFIAVVPRIVLAVRAMSIAMGSLAGPVGIGAAIAAFVAVDLAIKNTFQGGAAEAAAGTDAIISDVNRLSNALAGVPNAGGGLSLTIDEGATVYSPALQALRESLRTAEEDENASYQLRLAQLEQFRIDGFTTEADYNELRERIETEHRANLAGISDTAGAAEAVALQENLADQLEALQTSLLSEEQAEAQSYERRLAEARDFYDQGLVDAAGFAALKEGITAQHLAAVEEMTRTAAERELAIRQGAVSSVAGILGSLSQIIGTESEKQLAVSKKFASAEAIINTAQGITQALGEGPGRFFKAAAIAAAGAAQIASIRRTTSSGGSVTRPSSGGGTGGGEAGQPPAPGGGGGNSGTLTVVGLDPNQLYNAEMVRSLAKQLLDYQRDGGKVVLQ